VVGAVKALRDIEADNVFFLSVKDLVEHNVWAQSHQIKKLDRLNMWSSTLQAFLDEDVFAAQSGDHMTLEAIQSKRGRHSGEGGGKAHRLMYFYKHSERLTKLNLGGPEGDRPSALFLTPDGAAKLEGTSRGKKASAIFLSLLTELFDGECEAFTWPVCSFNSAHMATHQRHPRH
jgi:hypothetical protein